jgi:thimet oligopeptidase
MKTTAQYAAKKLKTVRTKLSADDSLLPFPAMNFTGDANFISSTEKEIISNLNNSINKIVSNRYPDGENTFAFSNALAQASLLSSQCTLVALVGSDAAARERSSESKKKFRDVFDSVLSNRHVYEKLCTLEEENAGEINGEMRRHFERRGVGLTSQEDREKVSLLSARIGELEGKFEQNINEDTRSVAFTRSELAGCPTSFIDSLDTVEDGNKCIVTMKAPHRVPVMKHCTNSDTRKRLQLQEQTRVPANESLLEELVSKREERAKLLGWSDHASFMLNIKMADTPDKVMTFINNISSRLDEPREKDLKEMMSIASLSSSSSSTSNETKTTINNWDYSFYARQLKEQKHSLDDEAIREYFPLDHVCREILSMYESLLNVEFRKFDHAPSAWHESVQGFAVLDKNTHELIGHFYLDLFSRPGKFGHQCVVPLAPSFVEHKVTNNGNTSTTPRRQLPACAILGNMTKPNAKTGRPSLLTFSEVKTFFHEFGHVMHAVLTRVDHSIHSWTWPMMPWTGGVQQDYLEVPSMMLEQFVYRQNVLERLSCHFETGEKLDVQTMESISNAKHFLAGLSYRRFLAFAVFDMIIHQKGKAPFEFRGQTNLSYRDLWDKCQEVYWGFTPQPNTHYFTTWYHMAIGYDAGYYSYLWSEVFAYDVLSLFPEEKEWDQLQEIGIKYRRTMLEPGGSISGDAMLQNFLGRAPSDGTFIREVFADTSSTSNN